MTCDSKKESKQSETGVVMEDDLGEHRLNVGVVLLGVKEPLGECEENGGDKSEDGPSLLITPNEIREKKKDEEGKLDERCDNDGEIKKKPTIATETGNSGGEDEGVEKIADVATEKSDFGRE